MDEKEKLGKILFITSIITLVYVSYIGFTKLGMWNDEIYTLGLIKSQFSDFINIVFIDVHPPLYYLIYKFFCKIFIGVNPIIIGKFTSLLPFYLILTLAFTKVRKNWGWLTCGLFAFCIVTMPQLMNFAVELRMYSWGLFFVTASFIYANEITNNSNLKNWTILTLLTIASAYTHYFSAAASFVIYLFLLHHVIKNKELKKYVISAVIAVLSFIPWLIILKQQVTSISNYYWIGPVTIKRIIGYVFFVFSPDNQVISANQIASFSILGLLLLIGVIVLLAKSNKKDSCGILIALCIPIIGIILSLLLRPIFHPRYIIPALGCLWLGVSIILSKNFSNEKIFIPIFIVILLTASVGCVTFTQNQINEEIEDNEETQILHEAFGSGNLIIYEGFNSYFKMNSYYLTDDHNFMLTVTEDKDANTTANKISEVLQDPGIQNEIAHGSKVYFISYKHSDNEIILNHDTYTLKKIPVEILKMDECRAYEVEIK